AAKLGMTIDQWRRAMLDMRQTGLLSMSGPGHDNDDLPAPDFPCGVETHPDRICASERMRKVVIGAMGGLPARYQLMVRMYYIEELSMKEIGQRLGVNESRISQIHKSALAKMATLLRTSGVTSSRAI